MWEAVLFPVYVLYDRQSVPRPVKKNEAVGRSVLFVVFGVKSCDKLSLVPIFS